MKINLSVFILIMSLAGCNLYGIKNIEITKEYIENENWNEEINLCVQRMKIREGQVLDILAPNFDRNEGNHWNVVNKLELDSSYVFNYFARIDNSPSEKMVYFDRLEKGRWRDGCYGLGNPRETIGNLESNTWYKISKLTHRSGLHIFLFIDERGNVHRFDHDLSNL